MQRASKIVRICEFAAHVALDVAGCVAFATAVGAGEIDTLVFGSLDAGAAQFATAGAKLGFGSLDRDGFAALASVGGGRRNERGDDGPRQRFTVGAAVVLGYQWFFDWGVVGAYVGPEIATEMLADRRGIATLPFQPGLRLQGEVWARPTEDTLVQATAVAGSARESLWLRVAGGYRLWGAYLGPEVSGYIDATGYQKRAFGLHGTDFDVGRFSARISVGLQTESGQRSASPYLAMSVWTPW